MSGNVFKDLKTQYPNLGETALFMELVNAIFATSIRNNLESIESGVAPLAARITSPHTSRGIITVATYGTAGLFTEFPAQAAKWLEIVNVTGVDLRIDYGSAEYLILPDRAAKQLVLTANTNEVRVARDSGSGSVTVRAEWRS